MEPGEAALPGPPAPVVLIAGTHGMGSPWWRPGSPFAQMLAAEGCRLLGAEGNGDYFRWSTTLDGVVGEHDDWRAAAAGLRWYAQAKLGGEPVSVVAHSHGGTIALLAAAQGLKLDRLITVATPVRADLRAEYRAAREMAWLWVHLYSDDSDWWQWAGSWFDGSWRLRRRMRWAELNLKVPGVGHSGLLDRALWQQRRWAYLLAGPRGAVRTRVELIKRGRRPL